MLSPLTSAERRAARYWFNDGLPTILIGAAYLLMSVFLLYPSEGRSSTSAAVVSFAAVVAYGLLLLRQRQILDWLKARITYPRTGYVAPPRCVDDAQSGLSSEALSLSNRQPSLGEASPELSAQRRRQLWLPICLTTAALLPILFVRNPWVCSVAGLMMSAAMWLAARRDQQLTWFALVGFSTVGITLTFLLPRSITGPERVAWFLAGSGGVFILDGVLALLRYLRANPRPAPTNQ